MSQQVWFLRHGEAEPHDARSDHDRRLTERGEGQAEAAGRALAALGLTFQAVFTSPKERALATARLACRGLGGEPMVHEPLAAGFDAREARALADGMGGDSRILVVGHNPDFEQAVHDLTGARLTLRKGGVAAVALTPAGELMALLRPRELDRLAGRREAAAS